MKLGSLFDGIGGALLCAKWSGIEPVWASEIEPFPIKVTKHHFPEVKHLGDITKINGAEIEPVDIIVGGSPCQDLSVAGKRAGMKHADFGDEEVTRSGLFMEQIRIVKEMRNATDRPRYMVWENVPGAFSSNEGEDFRAVLEETARVADPAVSVPRSVTGWANSGSILGNDFTISWRTFDAQYWGVPQRRRRIYLVADFGGQSAPEICFESEGVSGDITEGGEARKGITADAERSSGAAVAYGLVSKGNGEAFLMEEKHMSLCCGGGQAGQGYPAIVERRTDELCPTLRANMGDNQAAVAYSLQGSMIGQADHNVPQGSGVNEDVSFTLNTVDRHAVCYGPDTYNQATLIDTAFTLRSASGGDSKPAVCYGISSYESNAMKSSNPHSGIYEADTSRTLDQNGGNPACNQGGMLVFENHGQDSRYTGPLDVAPVVSATYGMGGNNQPFVVNGMKSNNPTATVRRLTPMECERLQGYPDNYTNIPGASDSARYKALGNSFAIPNAYFVISNISNYKDSPHGA